MRGDSLRPQGEQDAHEPRGPGGGEHVAYIGLGRAEGALAGRPARLAPERAQALDLHRVPDRGAGGMALDQVHVEGSPARAVVGGTHGPQLSVPVGGEEAAADVVGEPDPAQDAVDRVPLCERVAQALEHEHPGPFADHEAVAGGVQGGGAAGGGEGAQLAEAHLGIEALRPRDAAGEHGVGLARGERIAGERKGVEGGGASRVEGIGSASQAQGPRQQTGGQAGRIPVKRVVDPDRRERTLIRFLSGRPSGREPPRELLVEDFPAEGGEGVGGKRDVPQDDPDPAAVEASVFASRHAWRPACRAKWKTGSRRESNPGSASSPSGSKAKSSTKQPRVE